MKAHLIDPNKAAAQHAPRSDGRMADGLSINALAPKPPGVVDDLLEARIVNHSIVCLAELTHLFGRLDPANPGTKGVLRELRHVIEDMPGHRLSELR